MPNDPSIGPVFTDPVMVKSKRLKKGNKKSPASSRRKRKYEDDDFYSHKRMKVTMTFEDQKTKYGLELARGPISQRLSLNNNSFIEKAVPVLRTMSRQPCGILSDKGEPILVCRGCYIYFPQSAKTRHTHDCMIKQLLETAPKVLSGEIRNNSIKRYR
eukprot:UN32919